MKYRTFLPVSTAVCPRAIRVWLLPVPAGLIRVMFSFALIHSREHR